MRKIAYLMLALAGCQSFFGPDSVSPGMYELVAVNGTPLPFNEVELPISPVDPRPSGCYGAYTQGELEFGPPGESFRFRLVLRHSCLGHILSDRTYLGLYERGGKMLHMWTPSEVVEIEYSAVIIGRNILLTKDRNVYYFRPLSAELR